MCSYRERYLAIEVWLRRWNDIKKCDEEGHGENVEVGEGALALLLARKEEQALQLRLNFYLRLYNRRYAIDHAALIVNFLPGRHRHHRIRCHIIVGP